MLDQELVRFLIAALVIGAVVFGGTTLAYFLEQRRKAPHRVAADPAAQPVAVMTHDDPERHRDRPA